MRRNFTFYHPHPKDGEGTVLTGMCLFMGDGGYHMVSGPRSQAPFLVYGARSFLDGVGYPNPVTGPV